LGLFRYSSPVIGFIFGIVGDTGYGGFSARTSISVLGDSVIPVSLQWYHIVCVRESNALKIYVDSARSGDSTLDAHSASTDSTQPIRFGRRSDAAAFLDGRIDEARFYSKALNQTEVNSIYAEGLAGGVGDAYINGDSTAAQTAETYQDGPFGRHQEGFEYINLIKMK